MDIASWVVCQAFNSCKGRPAGSVLLKKLWEMSLNDFDGAVWMVSRDSRSQWWRKNRLRHVVANATYLFDAAWSYASRLAQRLPGRIVDHDEGILEMWDDWYEPDPFAETLVERLKLFE